MDEIIHLEWIMEDDQITSTMLKDILGVSKATIERNLSKLRKEDKIE